MIQSAVPSFRQLNRG